MTAFSPASAVTTVDLDIFHNRSQPNVQRPLRVLGELGTISATTLARLQPLSRLAGPGRRLLSTTCGDLDCLGTIDGSSGMKSCSARPWR